MFRFQTLPSSPAPLLQHPQWNWHRCTTSASSPPQAQPQTCGVPLPLPLTRAFKPGLFESSGFYHWCHRHPCHSGWTPLVLPLDRHRVRSIYSNFPPAPALPLPSPTPAPPLPYPPHPICLPEAQIPAKLRAEMSLAGGHSLLPLLIVPVTPGKLLHRSGSQLPLCDPGWPMEPTHHPPGQWGGLRKVGPELCSERCPHPRKRPAMLPSWLLFCPPAGPTPCTVRSRCFPRSCFGLSSSVLSPAREPRGPRGTPRRSFAPLLGPAPCLCAGLAQSF